jgi:Raf kinase inhibitor-like YbhB/YbcL family protein
MLRRVHTAIIVLGLAMAACSHDSKSPRTTVPAADLELVSVAFLDGQAIPDRYTCGRENASPPLRWSGARNSPKSFAIICEDPDAPGGTWVHWVIFDIPGTAVELGEPGTAGIPETAVQGSNDFGQIGYGGPCPPVGPPHRYVFTVYALNIELKLKEGATKKDVVAAMQGHIAGEGQLTGVYMREPKLRE